jgi:hypothetical protein
MAMATQPHYLTSIDNKLTGISESIDEFALRTTTARWARSTKLPDTSVGGSDHAAPFCPAGPRPVQGSRRAGWRDPG